MHADNQQFALNALAEFFFKSEKNTRANGHLK